MLYSAFYFPIENSSSYDVSVRVCDRMAVDDDNSIQLHAAEGIKALTSNDSDVGNVQSPRFLCPHDDDSIKLATSMNYLEAEEVDH